MRACLPKLWRVRSRQYRSRFLQLKAHFAPFSKIYKIAHFCTVPKALQFFTISQNFDDFSGLCNMSLQFYKNLFFSLKFSWKFDGISAEWVAGSAEWVAGSVGLGMSIDFWRCATRPRQKSENIIQKCRRNSAEIFGGISAKVPAKWVAGSGF